jgi:hypothetical protein
MVALPFKIRHRYMTLFGQWNLNSKDTFIFRVDACITFFCVTMTTYWQKQKRKDVFCLTVSEDVVHSHVDPWCWVELHGSRRFFTSWWTGSRQRQEGIRDKISPQTLAPTSISWSFLNLPQQCCQLGTNHSKNDPVEDILYSNYTNAQVSTKSPSAGWLCEDKAGHSLLQPHCREKTWSLGHLSYWDLVAIYYFSKTKLALIDKYSD